MRILTLRQPWAEWVARGDKDVENRGWATRYRGPLAIHAGKAWDRSVDQPPTPLDFGAIIAITTIDDCVWGHRSPWAIAGQWHWLLGDVWRLAEPVPHRGALGLVRAPTRLSAALLEQLPARAARRLQRLEE